MPFEAMLGQFIATGAVALFIVLVRGIAVRAVRRIDLAPDVRRRWLVQIRTSAILLLLFTLVVVWAAELRSVALSLVAVAVAVTIATKELLLSLSGALMRTSARAFAIGDRIQVGGFRGDVIDMGALSTKLLEVDEASHRRTGRAVTVPNSMFVDKPIVNETFASSYVLKVLTVPLEAKSDWHQAEAALLEAARVECEPFLEEARERIERASLREGLDPPIVDPTVSLVLKNPGEIELLLRFPTPVRRSNRVGQGILRRFLDSITKPKAKAPVEPIPFDF